MPRPQLITISVYADAESYNRIREAAGMENRSMSNYLLTLGLKQAQQLGVPGSKRDRRVSKRAKSGAAARSK